MHSGEDRKRLFHLEGSMTYRLEGASKRPQSVMDQARSQKTEPESKRGRRVIYTAFINLRHDSPRTETTSGTVSVLPQGATTDAEASDYSFIVASAGNLVFPQLPSNSDKHWKTSRQRTGRLTDQTVV